jgi:hypothetical protein
VVQAYLGDTGTMFAIDVAHGRQISEYSAFEEEQDIIIMPGARLCTRDEPLNFMNRLKVVDLVDDPTSEQEMPGLVAIKDSLTYSSSKDSKLADPVRFLKISILLMLTHLYFYH